MHIDTHKGGSIFSTEPGAYVSQPGMATYNSQISNNFSLPATAEATLLTPTSSSGSPSWQHHTYQHQHRRGTSNTNNKTQKITSKVVASAKPLTPPAVSSSMQYPYSEIVGPNSDEQPSSTPGYNLGSYSYTSSRENGLPGINSNGHSNSTMDSPYFPPYGSGPPSDNSINSSGISGYQYSPTNGTSAYLGHQHRPQQPSITSCAPPYGSSHYVQASHHQSLPQVDLAPMDIPTRTRNSRTLVNECTPQSADGRRATHNGSISSQGDQRIPRSQNGITGDTASIFRGNTSPVNNYHSSPDGAHPGSNGASSSAKDSIASTIPSELYNLCVTDKDHIVLNDKAPEDDRALFEIHAQQKGVRGKGMWDNITAQYSKCVTESPSTPCLQMKYTRAIRKYCKLPEEAFRRLLAIYEEDERNKYNRIWRAFRDSAKSGAELKAAEIEFYLVRLGLENLTQDEATKVRRRRRSAAIRRERKNAAPQDPNSQTSSAMSWNNSYSHMNMESHPQLSLPAVPSHPQHGQPAPGFEFSHMPTQPHMPSHAMTVAQEDHLMDEIDIKYGMGTELASNGSPGPNTPLSAQSMTNSTSHESHGHIISNGTDINGAQPRALHSSSTVVPTGQYASLARHASDLGHTKHEPWR